MNSLKIQLQKFIAGQMQDTICQSFSTLPLSLSALPDVPYELPLTLLVVNGSGNFLWHILCICLIDKVFKRYDKTVICRVHP